MKHVYEARIEELFTKYVPVMGSSDVLAGELIRAVCKLNYEMYNNGFGNNVSGALNFLDNEVPGLIPEFNELHEHSRGRHYHGNYSDDCPVVKAMNSLTSKVVEFINEHPETETTPCDTDMYSMEDEEVMACECCGCYYERYDFHYMYGHLCEECGEDQVRQDELEEELEEEY